MRNRVGGLDRGLLGGGIALGLAAVLFVSVTARAVVTGPLPALPDPVAEPGLASGGLEGSAPDRAPDRAPVPEVVPTEVLRAAVAGAPFQPDRQAPATRYRLPDEPLPAPPMLPPPPPELPPPPGFRLLGTIAGGSANEGAVVLLAVDDGPPQVLNLGESYMGYTVAQVVGDRAMLSGQGRNLSLTVQGPAATVAAAAGNRGRNAGPANTNNQGRNPAQQMQQMQELLRGGQGQNLTPEQRQRLMREAEGAAQELLQQILRGGGAGGAGGGQGGGAAQGVIQFRLPGGGGAATVIQGGGQGGGQGGAVQRQIIVRPGGGG
jgi:hypothetical protein